MAAFAVGIAPRALAVWGAPRLFLQELDAALLAIAEHPEIGHRLALHRYPNAHSFGLQRARLRRPLHHRSGAAEVTRCA